MEVRFISFEYISQSVHSSGVVAADSGDCPLSPIFALEHFLPKIPNLWQKIAKLNFNLSTRDLLCRKAVCRNFVGNSQPSVGKIVTSCPQLLWPTTRLCTKLSSVQFSSFNSFALQYEPW